MGIVIEGIRLIAGLDDTVQPMNCHIHQTQLGIVLHLFLSIKGHGRVGRHSSLIHKIAGLDEHTAASTGRIQQDAALWLQNIDDHFDQGFGREEHTIVRGDVLCEFVQEVFVNPAQNVPADFIQRAVIENTQQLGQDVIGEHGVILGQDAFQLFTLRLHQFHGIVDHFAQTGHHMTALIFQLRRGNVGGEIDQIIIPGFRRKIQSTFLRKIARLYRQHPPIADRAVFLNLRFHQLEPAKGIAQENQAQNGHTILIGSQLGALPQKIRRLPKLRFQLSDVYRSHFKRPPQESNP